MTAGFDAKYTGEASLVAYLGSTDTSASKFIDDSIEVEFNYDYITMNEISFADAGFGQGDGRTYYSAVVLGKVNVQKGYNEVTVHGVANNLNIGAISVIPSEAVTPDEPAQPSEPDQPAARKGCGGEIITISVMTALVGLVGTAFFTLKRKEN